MPANTALAQQAGLSADMSLARYLCSPSILMDVLDERAHLNGAPVRLSGKSLHVLRALMSKPQRLVTKDELIDEVWDGRAVSEAVITTAIREVRSALGDDARAPAFVETAHGRGYRFLEPVDERESLDSAVSVDAQAPAVIGGAKAPTNPVSPSRIALDLVENRPALSIAALFLLMSLFVWWVAAPSRTTTSDRPVSTADASLAVLPFLDFSPARDQEHFSHGLSEEILNVVTQVDGLKVASRTSSFTLVDRADMSMPDIADALRVTYVLEGSVRKAGDDVRVTAQLIDAPRDEHLWSNTYDAKLTTDSLFDVQDEIAAAVVDAIRAEIQTPLGDIDAGAISAAASARDVSAYELFLTARQLFTTRSDVAKAVNLLDTAVELDPDFANAWELLAAADFVASGGRPSDKAMNAAERALDLNPNLSLAHAVRGIMANINPPYDWAYTIANLRRAVELDPTNTSALLWLGVELRKLGYLEQSRAMLTRCQALDPAYHRCSEHKVATDHMLGRTDDAIAEYRRLLQENATPDDSVLVLALIERGDELSALSLIRDFSDESPMPEIVFQGLLNPEVDQADAEAALRTWIASASFNRRDAYSILLAYGAYDLIAAEQGSFLGLWLPEFPEFRQSERFKTIVRELGIDAYWRAEGFPPQCQPIGADDFACQ